MHCMAKRSSFSTYLTLTESQAPTDGSFTLSTQSGLLNLILRIS